MAAVVSALPLQLHLNSGQSLLSFQRSRQIQLFYYFNIYGQSLQQCLHPTSTHNLSQPFFLDLQVKTGNRRKALYLLE